MKTTSFLLPLLLLISGMLSAQRRDLAPELTELLTTADLVLEGSVAEQGTSVRSERGYLETPYTLHVDRVLAGQAVGVQDMKSTQQVVRSTGSSSLCHTAQHFLRESKGFSC